MEIRYPEISTELISIKSCGDSSVWWSTWRDVQRTEVVCRTCCFFDFRDDENMSLVPERGLLVLLVVLFVFVLVVVCVAIFAMELSEFVLNPESL